MRIKEQETHLILHEQDDDDDDDDDDDEISQEDTIEVVSGNGNMDLKPELNWFIVAESVLKVPLSFLR